MIKKSIKTIFEPEMPSVPEGWEILSFSKAASVISDQGKRIKQRDYLTDGKFPVIDQGQDLIGGYTDDEDMVFDGELPVILFGDHTRSIKFVDKSFAVGAEGIKILKPQQAYVPKFFFYLLKSLQIPSRGYSRHYQFLKKFYLPLASKKQQIRIVAEIEKQFSRLDEAVENLQRVKANLKRYKASVLKSAVEGKLTEQWRAEHPDVEPASQLLERILRERRKKWEENELAKMKAKGKVPKDDKWKKKYKELPKITTDELVSLPALSHSWTYVRLGALIEDPKYGTSKKCTYEDDGIGVLRIPNIIDGAIDVSDLKFSDFNQKEYKDYELKEGDLLTIRSNGSISIVGRCALVTKKEESYLYAGYLIRLRPFEKIICSKYLLYCFESLLVRKQIEFKAKSTSGVNNINAFELQSLIMPICSKNEQKIIVHTLESIFSVIKKVESILETEMSRADRLRQSILKKAFSGRLIPPLPAYDSNSVDELPMAAETTSDYGAKR